MIDINTVLKQQINLPSASVVVSQLSYLLGNENVSSHELAEIIKTDQSFTARIIKLVNSPFYGFNRKISSVEEAITMLGLNVVNQLLLATSVLKSFKADNKLLDINKFWLHSFGVGSAAKHLLVNFSNDLKNEAFLCGILHDIGRLIYIDMDQNKYMAFFDNGESVIDLEKESDWFGMNHQEVGAKLAEQWNFPSHFIDTIGQHHSPDNSNKNKEIVSAVHIADILCHALDIGNSGNKYVSNFSPEAWDILELEKKSLRKSIISFMNEINETIKLIIELQ